MGSLHSSRILVGISGGIAAYKSAELVRRLKDAGAEVQVVMTPAALEFITPLTLQALSGRPVHTQLLNAEAEAGMGHIELARWAHKIVIAPASADVLARLAHGLANDLLTTLCLASPAQLIVAPAMNQNMWRHPATQANMQVLTGRGVKVLGPAVGIQACGDHGAGRMVEPAEIVEYLVQGERVKGCLAGKKVVITAGPTREALDPVRYLSNHSSGKMGYALAAAAVAAGADTCLISGPTQLPTPPGVQRMDVVSAEQMLAASMQAAATADIFIGAAAVADFRPQEVSLHKIKKGQDEFSQLKLVKNPDILASVGALPDRPFMVGFAAETDNVEANAEAKRLRKNLDLIIANDVSDSRIGFDSDFNAVTLIDARGSTRLNERPKIQLAQELILAIGLALSNNEV